MNVKMGSLGNIQLWVRDMFTNRIETFDTLADAELFASILMEEAERSLDYFKVEFTLLSGRRWRVGVSTAAQMDLFDEFVE